MLLEDYWTLWPKFVVYIKDTICGIFVNLKQNTFRGMTKKWKKKTEEVCANVSRLMEADTLLTEHKLVE